MASPEIALLLELVLDLKKDIGEIKEDSIRNSDNIEEHMRRTIGVERLADLMDQRVQKLEKRDQMLYGFLKISGALLGLTATVLAILEAVRHL